MKIVVTGNNGCSRCDITKKILNGKNIPFEYQTLDELNDREKREVLEKAKDKGILALPIIEVNGEIVENVQEVLKLC